MWHWSLVSRHSSILELRELPVPSKVRFLGRVTYADGPGDRFWVQDETGAAVVPENPDKLHLQVGEVVDVEAVKTAHYEPLAGPASLELSQVKVRPSHAKLDLPPPASVALTNLPSPETNGLAVTMNGVIQQATADGSGRAHLSLAEGGRPIELIVAHPGASVAGLVNARVQVEGVTEQVRNTHGALALQRMWVPSGNSIRVIQAAQKSRLFSIRELYRDDAASNGHRIRVRGLVTAVYPKSVLLEDRWGAIECNFDDSAPLEPGAAIEAEGFPVADGLRIDLAHARATAIRKTEFEAAQAMDDLPRLTTVAAVRGLSRADAERAFPVEIDGVVTYNDPMWQQLFLEDQTGGIYLKYSGRHPELHPGARVRVSGISDSGNFAPVVLAPKIRMTGEAPLPKPRPVTSAEATAGLLDAQYVSIEGVVHPMKFAEEPSHPILTFELFTEIGQVHVSTSPWFPDMQGTRRLEDARVRIEGAFSTVFNSRRQLVGYQLLVSSPSQIETIEPAVPHPFEMPATPIGSLLGFSPGAHFGHRAKVAGAVTMVGQDVVYLQDRSGGVEIHGYLRQVQVGDHIEAVGYPTLEGRYSPVLSDAVVQRIAGDFPIKPAITTPAQVLRGQFDSQLVTIEGKLLTSLRGQGSEVLMLQSGVETFAVQLDTSDVGSAPIRFRDGSLLRVTGVSSAQINSNRVYRLLDRDPVRFKILLRSPADVVVIQRAPFWTLETVLPLLGLLGLLIVVILAWVDVLRRRVQQQAVALQRAKQTAQAIQDLTDAMHEVSHKQRFDSQVSVRGSEDIAQLVVGFNRMLVQLQQRDRAKREAEARLQHQALIDELTDLPNRRLLSDRLAQSLATARREHTSLALLYIDLDGFKLVNDSLGHAAGDILLTQVATRLRTRTRESDTLARIGGDEFTVILNHVETREEAQKVAEDLLECLSAPFHLDGHEIIIGASIGISSYPDAAAGDDNLLQQADSAMYAAKRSGKNRIIHFNSEMGVSVRERLTLETELRRAVMAGEISVHYQPEYDLTTHELVRFEALARWTHPNLGVIPPLRFIPVAEECGLIVSLGAYVLESACREAVAWQTMASRPVQVAVNVSSLQFARESFVEEVVEILERTGLPAHLLQLELTESSTLLGIEHAAGMIGRLKALGINIAMDDFGTGYSCLSYLPKLAFNAIKIDRSFISELVDCAETRALVESILTLAHNLDMKVIVEGIENQAQLELVRELGGNEAQGFLLGRPTPNPREVLRMQWVCADEAPERTAGVDALLRQSA